MGQKVNPHGLRVGVIKDWDSRWYAKDEKVGDLLVEDYKDPQVPQEDRCTTRAFPKHRDRALQRQASSPCSCTAAAPAWSSARAALRSRRSARAVDEAMIGKTVKLNIVEVRISRHGRSAGR